MRKTSQWLGENVCQLKLGIDMAERDQSLHKLLSDKMAIKFDVLGSIMIYGILGNVDSSLVVTLERNGSDIFYCELM